MSYGSPSSYSHMARRAMHPAHASACSVQRQRSWSQHCTASMTGARYGAAARCRRQHADCQKIHRIHDRRAPRRCSQVQASACWPPHRILSMKRALAPLPICQ